MASRVSAEIMTSKSSTHSFWVLIGVSLVMMVIKVIFEQLVVLKGRIPPNWHPWVTILAQTMLGLETIVWTLYGTKFLVFLVELASKCSILLLLSCFYRICNGPVDYGHV